MGFSSEGWCAVSSPAPTQSAIFEGFSVSHAQILSGSETFLEALARTDIEGWDVYGVNEASMEPDTDNYDNEGDDAVLSKWNWLNFVELSVQAGYVSFPLISNMTGAPITSTAGAGTTNYSIDLWSETMFNIQARPMLIRMPSRDKTGKPCSLVAGLYRVNFAPITFDGPSYKEGLKVNYNGQAVLSQWDETGTEHTDKDELGATIKKVGKLIAVVRN